MKDNRTLMKENWTT